MKKLILCLAVAVAMPAFAQVSINRTPLGSGTPGETGREVATPVMDGMLHAPQYLPGYPTAATIFPRVVDVECTKAEGNIVNCKSYNWMPEMGRGEYLFIRPVLVEPVKPQVITKEVPVVVIKEVPVKPKKE